MLAGGGSEEGEQTDLDWLNATIDELFKERGPNIDSWLFKTDKAWLSEAPRKAAPEIPVKQLPQEKAAVEETDLDLLLQAARSSQDEQASSASISRLEDDVPRKEQVIALLKQEFLRLTG